MKRALENTRKFIVLVGVKVRFNLRSEAAKNRLSYTWWLLEPVLHLGVFYVIFGIFLNRGGEDFVAFLNCGIVPWLWFSHSVTNSTLSMVAGKGLISQTHIPKFFFPLVTISQDAVKQLFVFIILFVYIIWAGYGFGLHWLWLVPVIMAQFVFTAAVAFLVAFAVPFAQDLRYLITTLLTFGMLSSGVFYSYTEVLLPQHQALFLVNPMANLIADYRLILMEGKAPMLGALAAIFFGSLVVLSLVAVLIKRFDNRLTRILVD